MTPPRILAPALLALLVLAGCGGGGGPKGSSALSRKRILSLLGRAIDSSAGLRASGRGTAQGDRALRLKVKPHAGAKAASRADPGDGDGDIDLNPILLNEWTGLWEKQQWGVADDTTVGSGTVFFEDEAGAVPAGGDLTYASDGVSWPRWVRQEIEYKAGRFAGTKVLDYSANNEDGTGVHTATAHYPGEAEYTLDGRWDDAGMGVWTQRWDYVDGAWENQVWTTLEDLSDSLVITTDAGVTFDMVWNLDASGRGTIRGDFDGLPATIEWDAEGNGAVTWSDGTKTRFEGWAF